MHFEWPLVREALYKCSPSTTYIYIEYIISLESLKSLQEMRLISTSVSSQRDSLIQLIVQ